jgi:Raf kinase inhibitor-like YbhB/YbcL family protein
MWRKRMLKHRWPSLILVLLIALLAFGCGGEDTEPVDNSDASDASDASDSADPSDASDASDASDMSDVSDEADAADMSDVSDEADAADMSDASDEADAADMSDASDEADAADMSDASDESDASDMSDASDASDTTTPDEPFTLTSDAMEDGGVFPVRHACSYYYGKSGAENISPQFGWSGAPEGTQSFAIVFRDLTYDDFLHSIIYDIPANVSSLPESLPRDANLSEPSGAKQSRGYTNDFGYEGPCPGWEAHEYQFEIYAMPYATLVGVNMNTGMEQIEAVIKSGDIESTTLTAVFTPPAQ